MGTGQRCGFGLGRALAGLALLLGAGCESVSDKALSEEQIAREQVVIESYSARVPEVDGKLKVFLEAWEKANANKDLKALKEALKASVMPAFTAHISALESMPAGSEGLRKIHEPLVTAYKAAFKALETFGNDVTETNVEPEYAKVLTAMDAVKKAEEVYFKALEAHYQLHRVTLKTSP